MLAPLDRVKAGNPGSLAIQGRSLAVTKAELLCLLEDALDVPPQTLTGAEALRDVPAWDSMGTLTFITMVDRKFGKPLPAADVLHCETVKDLLRLMGEASRLAA